MHEKIGYARVSTASQNLDAQTDALKQAGCTKIFTDKESGVKEIRPGWQELIEYIRSGDTLVITELSRMSRSLVHLLQVVKELEERNVELVSLRENIDTSTATGRCFLSIMGAVAQMEREIKAERATAGRAAAKARGRTGGRPRIDPEALEQACILYQNSETTAAEVCERFGFSRKTLFNYIQKTKQAA